MATWCHIVRTFGLDGHLVSSCIYFWVRWPLGVILYILLGSMATGCHLVRGYRDCHTCRSKYLTPLQPSPALFHNQLSPLPLACILATSVPFGHSVCVPPPLTLFFFSSSSFFFFFSLKKTKQVLHYHWRAPFSRSNRARNGHQNFGS